MRKCLIGLGLAPIVLLLGPSGADAAGSGRFWTVDPKGTYLPALSGDSPAKPAEVLLGTLKLKAWDYVGLMAFGRYCTTPAGSTCVAGGRNFRSSMLLGAFRSQSGYLAPAPGAPWLTGGVAGYTDIQQDFIINGPTGPSDPAKCAKNQVVPCNPIVRVPTGATKIAFSTEAGNRKFNDNYRMTSKFGGHVSKPNSAKGAAASYLDRSLSAVDKLPGPSAAELRAVVRGLPNLNDPCVPKKPRLPLGTYPPISKTGAAAEYRGWISGGKSIGWKPQSSIFLKNPPAGLRRHLGIDIFAPALTELFAPMEGCVSYARSSTWGDYAAVSFGVGADLYHLILAHTLDPAWFVYFGLNKNKRRVAKGALITRSHCTGNAKNDWCGQYKYPEERRTDHLHVALLKNGVKEDPAAVNPVSRTEGLGWKIRLPCPLPTPVPPGVRCDKP